MQVSAHKQGTPSWFELATSDEAAAVSFYDALFNWADEAQPLPDGHSYHMQRIGDDTVAAIAHQQAEEAAQGIPPHWNVYISVDDLDAVTDKVTAAGGNVIHAPFEVMDAGRMAVITDPTGGVVCLWEARDHIGAQRMREPGAPTWAELATGDPERAGRFFSELLGVQVQTNPMPEGEPYTMLEVGGEGVAGVYKLTPEMGDMPPGWMAYFGAEDVDAAAEKAQSLGGSLLVPPTDIPGGRFAVLMDPQQAVFGLFATEAA